MTVRNFRTALLSAALLLTAIPLAANAGETRSITVRSGDLNLASEAGRAAFQHRVARAVAEVCGPTFGRTTEQVQAYASCAKTAQANAAPQMDAMVAAAKSGKKIAAGPAPSVR